MVLRRYSASCAKSAASVSKSSSGSVVASWYYRSRDISYVANVTDQREALLVGIQSYAIQDRWLVSVAGQFVKELTSSREYYSRLRRIP